METTTNKMTDQEYRDMLQVWVNQAAVTASAAVEAYEAETEEVTYTNPKGEKIAVGDIVRSGSSKIEREVYSIHTNKDGVVLEIVADRIDGSFAGPNYVNAWRAWMSPEKVVLVRKRA
jgi:hypothetical protein